MPGLIHPTAASGWSLSGSILTFAMPMLLFIAAATVLYLLFSRPHRVPGHRRVLAAVQAAQPDPGTARAMAAAAGLTTEAGAGSGALPHEPAAGVAVADDSAANGSAADASATDASATDGSATDGGVADGSATDASATDGGVADGGVADASVADASGGTGAQEAGPGAAE